MQRDPLTILIERGDGPLACTPLSLPRLTVTIKNVDIEFFLLICLPFQFEGWEIS